MEKIEYELLNRRELTYFWHVGRREILREALRRHVGGEAKATILDVGCATGGNLFLLNEFGRVTGLDNSDDALAFARRRGIPTLIKANATRIPLADATFTIVTALDIFEHVEDDRGALQEAFRVLRPGGFLLATVPAHSWLFSAHDRFLHHVRRYSRNDFLEKCASTGFAVLEDSHFVTLGVPMNMFRKFCDRLFYGKQEPVRSYDVVFKPVMNTLMLMVLRFEKLLMRFVSLPFGTSFLVIMRKPDVGETVRSVPVFPASDFWKAFVAGAAIAILSLPVLKNLRFFDLDFVHGRGAQYVLGWIMMMPLASAGGLYGAYRLSLRWWPVLFTIGKYGLIGWLNTFLSAGLFNLFVLMTGIAAGWIADVFVTTAFVITVTHSFFWNKFWVFDARKAGRVQSEYIRFFGVSSGTALLNIAIFHVMVNTIGAPAAIDPTLWANIALAILILISFLGNFLGYRTLVFRRQR